MYHYGILWRFCHQHRVRCLYSHARPQVPLTVLLTNRPRDVICGECIKCNWRFLIPISVPTLVKGRDMGYLRETTWLEINAFNGWNRRTVSILICAVSMDVCRHSLPATRTCGWDFCLLRFILNWYNGIELLFNIYLTYTILFCNLYLH